MPVPEASRKAATSVRETATLCLLSRSRFHSLVRQGVFPPPVQGGEGRRPFYTQELLQRCLEIRSTGIGQDGKVVLFNRPAKKKGDRKRPSAIPATPAHADLIESLRALGLTATSEAVDAAVRSVFPDGTTGLDQGEVIRRVFLHLQGRKS